MKIHDGRTLPQWLHLLDVGPVSPHESRQRSLILVSSSLNCEQWVFILLVPETFPTQGSSAAAVEGTRAGPAQTTDHICPAVRRNNNLGKCQVMNQGSKR